VFVESSPWAFIITFVTVMPLWAMNLVAGQIEQPFGDDANDLPLDSMMMEMNAGLLMLLDSRSHVIPHLRSGVETLRNSPKNRHSLHQSYQDSSRTMNSLLEHMVVLSQVPRMTVTSLDETLSSLARSSVSDHSFPLGRDLSMASLNESRKGTKRLTRGESLKDLRSESSHSFGLSDAGRSLSRSHQTGSSWVKGETSDAQVHSADKADLARARQENALLRGHMAEVREGMTALRVLQATIAKQAVELETVETY